MLLKPIYFRVWHPALPWLALSGISLLTLGLNWLLLAGSAWRFAVAAILLVCCGFCLRQFFTSLRIQSRRTHRLTRLMRQRSGQLRQTNRMLRQDISARRRSEAALQLHQGALLASASAMFIIEARAPDFKIAFVNPAFERLTGYSAQALYGQPCCVWQHNPPGSETACSEIHAALHELRAGNGQLCSLRKDGSVYWSHLYLSPIRDQHNKVSHFIGVQFDITETRRYQSELEYHASRDVLTGLANRNLLHNLLGQALAYAVRYQHPVWVVFLNLDRFKFINDTLGHKAGDQLLQISAQRLLSAVRETDTVARLGADEFVLVFPERVTDRNAEHLSTKILQRCLDALAQPVSIMGHEFFPTASAGVAAWPGDGDDADTLLKHADIALDRAKQGGRNQFQFFTSSMNQQALARLRIEGDLRNALERGEFALHYQPQVDLRTGHIVGMEALIRWHHPLIGMIAPQHFIGLAEETGLIVPIGAWVLTTACAQAMAWQRAGLGVLRIAVNLSARQFAQADLVAQVAQALQQSGLPPACLEIELTETLIMHDVEHAIHTLRELKALGIKLSVDDFGTGYSSLSYLKRFPIDVLKIDQSFVRDITLDPDDAAITLSIISLAHSLRLQVIAEGVETEAQLSYLCRHRCDQMQGYYFSRPLPALEFEKILRSIKILPLHPNNGLHERQNLLLVSADDDALYDSLEDDAWRVWHANASEQTLQLMALHPMQILVWQQNTTIELDCLLKAHALYPQCSIIMVGTDFQSTDWLELINRIEIFRVCTSENPSALRAYIREGFARYWQEQSNQQVA